MPDAVSKELEQLARHQRLQNAMELVLGKLTRDARSISTEDVQSLSDNAEEGDSWTADIIAAVTDLSVRSEEGRSAMTAPANHLSQVAEDLRAAVRANPCEVNTEILRTTQGIVRMMQKAIGHTNAPHPELEAELQQEYAKIVPKVEQGIITKTEADHLHSLETIAHGHTERDGLTAIAQSISSRRNRQASNSNASISARSRANSRIFTLQNQSHSDDANSGPPESESERKHARVKIEEPFLQKEQNPHEQATEKSGGISPSSSMRRFHSLSDSTNATRGDSRHDAAFPKLQSYGSADTGGGSENMPRTRKREASQPAAYDCG